MTNTEFISQIEQMVAQLPTDLMRMKELPEKRGALLYSGPVPDVSQFHEWVEKALWMLENSAVAARNLPAGKFVALAYKGGYVIISDDLKDSLSEEMFKACRVVTYSDFGLERGSTCLVFTRVPFELSIVFNGDVCMVFLAGNSEADVVVYSPERLRQIMVH
jgi:hypothetical protein